MSSSRGSQIIGQKPKLLNKSPRTSYLADLGCHTSLWSNMDQFKIKSNFAYVRLKAAFMTWQLSKVNNQVTKLSRARTARAHANQQFVRVVFCLASQKIAIIIPHAKYKAEYVSGE